MGWASRSTSSRCSRSTLAVGIVIDDAIVVLENIFRFIEEKKLPPMQAAVEGTKEIGLAVLATTLSLIAVFLPVAFMGGIVGRFMNSFGVTMAFAIAVSLLVSFTLTPMMAARWLAAEARSRREKTSREHGRLRAGSRARYIGAPRLVAWRHRWVVVAVMALTFLATIPLGAVANKNFLPDDDESQFEVAVRAPEGTSLESTQTIMESIAERVRAARRASGTRSSRIGDDPQKHAEPRDDLREARARKQRKLDQFEVMDAIRTAGPAAVRAARTCARRSAASPPFGGGDNAEIQFWIGGPDLDQLETYSTCSSRSCSELPGAVDVDTNLVVGKPELGVHIDRAKAGDLGVRVAGHRRRRSTCSSAARRSRTTTRAASSTRCTCASEAEYRARLRRHRPGPGARRRGGPVRLQDVVRFEQGTGPSLDQPPHPPAAGAPLREHAARLLERRRSWTGCRRRPPS